MEITEKYTSEGSSEGSDYTEPVDRSKRARMPHRKRPLLSLLRGIHTSSQAALHSETKEPRNEQQEHFLKKQFACSLSEEEHREHSYLLDKRDCFKQHQRAGGPRLFSLSGMEDEFPIPDNDFCRTVTPQSCCHFQNERFRPVFSNSGYGSQQADEQHKRYASKDWKRCSRSDERGCTWRGLGQCSSNEGDCAGGSERESYACISPFAEHAACFDCIAKKSTPGKKFCCIRSLPLTSIGFPLGVNFFIDHAPHLSLGLTDQTGKYAVSSLAAALSLVVELRAPHPVPLNEVSAIMASFCHKSLADPLMQISWFELAARFCNDTIAIQLSRRHEVLFTHKYSSHKACDPDFVLQFKQF